MNRLQQFPFTLTFIVLSVLLAEVGVSAQAARPFAQQADDYPPMQPLHPPAPLQQDHWAHAPQCGEEECMGTAPAHFFEATASGAAAKRTRGTNTQLVMPRNLQLVDINADGLSDFVQFAGNRIFVSNTEYAQAGILHYYHHIAIKRLILGDFQGNGYDQTCLISVDNVLTCFGTSPDRTELWWWFTQGAFASDDDDLVVSDYDGDGRDDVLVYSRAGQPFRMYSVKGDFFFEPTPAFAQGNLESAVGRGMRIRAGDFNGDGRADILAVNRHRQLIRYDSVFDGTNQTFWWAFTSVGGFAGEDDHVSVARINADAVDDVVLHNWKNGATRFYHLEWADGYLPSVAGVPTGQIDVGDNRLLFWGFMHSGLNEPGAVYRDDAMVYVLGADMFVRSDARWDGGTLTYWWAYTQHAPNNHQGWAPNTAKRWLFIKCKFADITAVPQPDAFYQNLNAAHVQYWREITYGSWDLSGSVVDNAWYMMTVTNEQWRNLPGRGERIYACVSAYGRSTDGYQVAVIVNGEGDAGSDGWRILLTPDSSNLTFLAHEAGHGFGWGHSFDDSPQKNAWWSGPGEYFDTWDIMSAMSVFTFMHPQGTVAGPEMNAPYRTKQALIPAHRIIRLSPSALNSSVQLNLAALNRPEAGGPLMVRIGEDDNNYFAVEYRVPTLWDQGILQPAVLVRRVTNGTSYLITGNGAERLIGAVYTFSSGGASFTLRVNGFAATGYMADVTFDATCEVAEYQVALFADANYTGPCIASRAAEFADTGVLGLPNDAISSVKVGAKATTELCVDSSYGGTCEKFFANDPDLTDNTIGNDSVSSAKVSCRWHQDWVVLFEHSDYRGDCAVVAPGEYPYPWDMKFWNDVISSLLVGQNVQAVLCQRDNYGGVCEKFAYDKDSNLSDNEVGNDSVSSLKVEWRACDPGPNQAALYTEAGMKGKCISLAPGAYGDITAFDLPDNAISSVRVGHYVAVELCSDFNFSGVCEVLFGDEADLADNLVGNDQVSSFRIISAVRYFLPIIENGSQ